MIDAAQILEETWDVSARRIARVYAESLLNAAEKEGQAESVLDELNALVNEVFKRDPHVETLFSSAAVGRHTRAHVLAKAFQGRTSEIFYRFLMVLNDHERLDLLRTILTEARALYDERRQRVRVLIYSAVPINEAQQKIISDRVRERFKLEPLLVAIHDPSLLGGLKVRIGDRQIDATVRARLDQIRQQMMERSSHEIQSGRDRFSSPV